MTPEEIITMYDTNPDLTLAALSRRSGWSVSELKTLLLGG
jgi:lambda repressor-like predicted transcriptional regulator